MPQGSERRSRLLPQPCLRPALALLLLPGHSILWGQGHGVLWELGYSIPPGQGARHPQGQGRSIPRDQNHSILWGQGHPWGQGHGIPGGLQGTAAVPTASCPQGLCPAAIRCHQQRGAGMPPGRRGRTEGFWLPNADRLLKKKNSNYYYNI